MSNKPIIGGHLVGPFSTPVAYENPDYSGFIGFARNSIDEPVGKEATILYKNSKGEWKAVKSKTRTKFGNISWRGPKKKEDKEYPRWVISYHGPQTRSLPTELFTYGSEAKHREVYMGGGIVGIAPGPVLGACLQIIEKVRYLLVVYLAGGAEKVIRRKLAAPVFSNSGPALEALAKFAEDKKDKKGWHEVGAISVGSGYLPPETPWFFNESGTQAQCMRRKEKTAVVNGIERMEKAADRFKLHVAGLYVEPLGNKPAVSSYSGWSHAGGGFFIAPDPYSVAHIWRTYFIDSGSWSYGEQVVAVDYDGDTEVLARIEVSNGWYAARNYMEGCDTEFRFGGLAPNDTDIPPWILPPGGRYYNPYCMGYPRNEGGFQNGQISILYPRLQYPMLDSQTPAEKPLRGTRLLCGSEDTDEGIVLESTKRLSAREYASGLSDFGSALVPLNASIVATGRQTDPIRIGRVEYAESFVRHLDLRDKSGVSLVTKSESVDDYNIGPVPSLQTDRTTEELYRGTDDHVFLLPKGPGVQSTFSEGLEEFPEPIDMRYPDQLYAQFREVIGWPEANIIGWPRTADNRWFATTWSGRRPTDNDEAEINNLPVSWFIPGRQERWRAGWHGVLTAFHDKHYPNYPHYGACGEHYIVSGRSLGAAFGEMEGGNVLSSNIPNIATLIGGAVFHPFSEL